MIFSVKFSNLVWNEAMHAYQYHLNLKAEFVAMPQAHGVCDLYISCSCYVICARPYLVTDSCFVLVILVST